VFALCQIVLGSLLIAGIIAVKFIKTFLGVNPGEIIGLFPIVGLSLLILAPICVTLGFIFPLACSISHFSSRPGNTIGNVYALEAVGSIIGGVITSIILVRSFDALHIAAIFACLNFFAAFFLAHKVFDRILKAVSLLAFIVIIALWSLGGLKEIEHFSLKQQWRGYEVLEAKNSIYGNILIANRGEDYSLFNNGLRLYTIPDKLSSEEAAHLALLQHQSPKRMLLIGGGVGGLIEEILKHRVERVDYLELDPAIIKISERNLPESYYKALKDPRVSIKNVDGRYFIRNTKEKYDCVIIHTGDPYTAESNRYYTAEFFNDIKKTLKEGGLISFGLTSSESYISKPLAEFLRSIYATLRSVFNEVLVIPGETAYFLASDSTGRLTYDHKVLEERTLARNLDTQYVRDYYLFSKLSPEKIAYSEKIIMNTEGAVINHDSRPIAYYYGLIFWTTLFRDSVFSNILRSVTESIIWRSIGIFVILLAIISVTYRRSFKRAALMALMTGGFSSMAFQLLILLTFQAMYGYLFYKMGIILTAFMAGLAIGAILVIKVIHISRGGFNLPYYQRVLLIAAQGDFIIFSVLLGVLFSRSCPDFLFPVLSVIAGSIGGAQFAIANKVLLGRRRDVATVGGLSYGIDLFGSFFGALLTGIFLIPILGIPNTCFAVALINLSVLAMLLINVSVEE
jgi:spermidine synthase